MRLYLALLEVIISGHFVFSNLAVATNALPNRESILLLIMMYVIID